MYYFFERDKQTKKDAHNRWTASKLDPLATNKIIFKMGKMTPRRARALPDHPGWPIATFISRLPSDLGSPQRQGSGEIPEQEHRNQRAGPSRTWWASHSLSPNGHLPWLPGTCVFGWQSSVGSIGAHGQRQSCGACGAGKGLLPATKWVWLLAPKPSVYCNGSHTLHWEPEAGIIAPIL